MNNSSVTLSKMLRTPGRRAGALLLSAAAFLGLSTGAAAATSDPAELRGYNSCLKAAPTGDLTDVTLPRVYYIAKHGDSNTYYVNAFGWRDGVRVAKRITCETSLTGRKVYSVQAADGRYARRSETSQATVAKR